MRTVLADTGPLYAVAVRSDQYHDRALHEMARLMGDKVEIAVPYPILLETYSLILRRGRIPVALSWLAQMTESVTLIDPSSEEYRQATERVRRFSDQPITLFDALIVAMSDLHDFDIRREGRRWAMEEALRA
jgi:predicted nucleic acid-binding protein